MDNKLIILVVSIPELSIFWGYDNKIMEVQI